MMTVKTGKVEGRRTVTYRRFDELEADAERLAAGQVRTLGNWSLGQIFSHLAITMNGSIDGFPGSMPWPMQILAKLLMRKMILRGPLKPGFKLPKKAESKMVPAEMSTEAGLEALKASIARQKSSRDRVRHPALGAISRDEWIEAHLRHAELHMSFADCDEE